jgi:hypothetical protein
MNGRTIEKTLLSAAGGGVGAVVDALRRALGAQRHSDPTEDRWHAVTVNRAPTDVAPDGRLPEPLAAMIDHIEVRVRPAPGDKGTEIHARLLREMAPGDGEEDPRRALRRALRESRCLLEIGEVIQPNLNRTTEPTPLNRPIAAGTQHGREEGLL